MLPFKTIQRVVDHKLITVSSTVSYNIDIHIAGDVNVARQALREYVNANPLCVTLYPVEYIYTGGLETGIRVGLINYPRFPKHRKHLREQAVRLAEYLRTKLAQESYTITSPDNSVWVSSRNQN